MSHFRDLNKPDIIHLPYPEKRRHNSDLFLIPVFLSEYNSLARVLFYKSTDYASLSNVYRKKGQVGGFETGFVTLSEGYLKEMRAFNYTAQLQVSVFLRQTAHIQDVGFQTKGRP